MKLDVRYPFVRGLPDHAFFLSAIADERKVNNWIANQYIHVTCNKNFLERKKIGFDFYLDYFRCPYLEIGYVPLCLIGNTVKEWWDVIRTLVSNKHYIALFLDENIIPNSQFYQQGKKSYHNNFVYGYDENAVLLGSFNKVGKYIFDKIPLKLFLKALVIDESRRLQIIKRIENDRYGINLQVIINSLKDYIEGVEVSKKYDYIIMDQASEWKAYGWEVYKFLIQYYRTLKETNLNLDIRPLFMLVEHKKCMLARIDLLKNSVSFDIVKYSNDFRVLQEESHRALLYALKYMYVPKEQYLDIIAKKLKFCGEKEKEVYPVLINSLEKEIR